VTRSGRGIATLGIALACTPVPPLTAQATASVDLGGMTVRYEGFLASGAFFASPAARVDLTGASLAAQGTYLVFESGNRILQGTAAAAWLPSVREAIRPEFGGSVGVSSYTGAPDAGHVLGRLRFHAGPGDRGVWLGGAIGRSFLGSASYGSSEVGAGAWLAMDWLGLAVGSTYSRAGDTSYVDATANVLWRLRWIQLDGLVGARAPVGQGGGGEGVYGEVSGRVRLAGPLELLVSAGRYPSDPVRGALGGQFATVSLRLSARTLRRRASAALIDLLRREPRAAETVPPAGAPTLSLGEAGAGMRLLRIRAPGATFIEIAADFTDWEPVALQRVDADDWEIVLPIARGAHRANVRVDGGPWTVPRGTRLERDEYGGEVGVLVVW
jgi:hypothetical protein